MRLRIRYTNDIAFLKQNKFKNQQNQSRISINSIDGKNHYVCSAPAIDFPFNMKGFDGKFDNRTLIYLQPLHINAFKQTLKHMLRGISTKDLFYYMNGELCMDQSIANRDVQVLPMKGMLFEMYYCIIREPSQTGNGISVYEGIRIINRQLNTISELTVDELSLFISILDSINITDILMTATQIGLNLINQ